MKIRWFLAVFICLPFIIFGQNPDDFNSVVDFESTLGSLMQAVVDNNPFALPDKFIIVDGAVASRVVVNGDADQYLGELELVAGEWIGVESVVRYQCILQLIGPEFAAAIPARRSRRANPNEIKLNSRILVVAKATGIRENADGEFIPVLRAYYIRSIR
ncbi:MAG: hypothetical protein CMN78_02770 [Spirochaetales bacterium]|nr:hypothetical protein [Spirochaetales bacterium]